ncbi:hypothetical protein LB572_05760 [Mesorhizobium sp. BH1-1-5]|uniref:hypothetical protein n=1 Tax=unclassified Mesorhizobium TaxID=325217 RepID=UPI00112D5F02|nr:MULTISPECIES: hypothetical protein [unclassified Mesorhizobium]MBZ9986600.1 hypothetical protein [Mesorhizobium sp. BH1-1-5]TPJ43673.1 hypothetical protein FJ471_33220 [Mesorhizobium sp. B2-7-1]
MKTYRVEEIDGETIVAVHAAEAKTPFEAAERALGQKVTLRAGADRWVRVVDLTERPRPVRLRPTIFEFKAIGQRK